jgi:hypothetical protein
LESIEVYTVRDNVNLVDVLKAMEASAEKLPDEKDNAALKSYFSKVYPDLDFDRVYSSDLKKMVKWFHVLRSNNIEIKLSEPKEAVEEADDSAEVEAPAPKARKTAAEKPAAKEEKEPAKPKAPAAKKAAPKAEKEEEEKPKAAAKKSAASEKPAASSSSKKTAKEAAPKAEKEEKPKKAAATPKKSADKKKS